MKINDLKQKYNEAFAEMEKLKNVIETENRAFSNEERERWNAVVADCESLSEKISVLEKSERFVPKPLVQNTASLGLSEKERKNFSIVRAIRAAVTNDWSAAGYEKEISEAAAKLSGKTPQGFYLPFEVLKRDLTAGIGAAGGYTVATDVLSGSFIDVLRKRAVVLQAGAQFLTGLRGNVAIPKLTSGATAYWVSENASPTESNPVFGQVLLTPKTMGTYIDFSRTLLLQSSVDVEALCRDMLNKDLSVAIDAAALVGTGTGGQPTGILSTADIGAVTWATNDTPTFSAFVDMETAVASQNALSENMFYVFNAAWAGKCKTTPKITSTDSRMLMENNEINGRACIVSEQLPNSTAIFGNFADLLIGIWGNGVDILVDPYTGSAAGTTRVRALVDCDVAVRHSGSFAKATN